MQKTTRDIDLSRIWRNSLKSLSPEALVARNSAEPRPGEAVLYWGKAAARTWACFPPLDRMPGLVVSDLPAPQGPLGLNCRIRWIQGEHPLPGAGSFAAGRALLEFFDTLRRLEIKKLRIFLSGGASTLAWIPAGISEKRLHERLLALAARGLPIDSLNRRRSRLCILKAGGAARWLYRLAPRVQAQVELISDVAPFGPEVVGSGPFFDGKINHRILADNCTWVRAFAQEAKAHGFAARPRCGAVVSVRKIARELEADALRFLKRNQETLLIVGCEPTISLSEEAVRRPGRGGRMTHLAAELLGLLSPWAGRIEVLCASSDGRDGHSGAAATWLSADTFGRLASRERFAERLKKALAQRDSAGFFLREQTRLRMRILVPSFSSGTNVQDLVALRVMAGPLL